MHLYYWRFQSEIQTKRWIENLHCRKNRSVSRNSTDEDEIKHLGVVQYNTVNAQFDESRSSRLFTAIAFLLIFPFLAPTFWIGAVCSKFASLVKHQYLNFEYSF